MKNTKHTENLDNSTPQEITSQSKRKILTSIGVSSGIIGASALSQQWTKPIVNSIILPAHAHTTDAATHKAEGHEEMDGKYHDDNGMHFTTEPMPDDDDTTTTTTEDMGAMGPMIVVSKSGIMLKEGASVDPDDTDTYTVHLSTMPEEDVMVTLTGQTDTVTITDGDDAPITTLTFTPGNYMTPQEVTVTAVTEADISAGTAGDETAIILHTASAYTLSIASVTVVVMDQDVFTPDLETPTVLVGASSLTATQALDLGKAELGAGELVVYWSHEGDPDDKAQTTGYTVEVQKGDGTRFMEVGGSPYPGDARNSGILMLEEETAYTVRVTAMFEGNVEDNVALASSATTS